MSSNNSFSHTVRCVLPSSTSTASDSTKSKTVTYQNLSQIESRQPLDVFCEEEESENEDDNLNEYNLIKSQIKQIKSDIMNYNKQIENLNEQISTFEAENEFLEKHQATLFLGDSDHIDRQTRKSKKIVHKQKLLDELMNETNELQESFSSNSIFFLKEAVKKEKKEYEKAKEKVMKNREKIEKVEEKLRLERKNPIYEGIKEQIEQINELEVLISCQIKEGNKLKKEFCQLELLDQENENEIQDLQVSLTTAKYQQEKRQRQFLHLLKKQEIEIEELKNEPVRSLAINNENSASRRLFVGTFASKELSPQIQAAFGNCGEIEFTRLIGLNSKPQKYFAQIQYFDHESAKSAIQKLNRKEINGTCLNIQWASDQPKFEAEPKKTKRCKKVSETKKVASANIRPITTRLIHPHQSPTSLSKINE